MGNAGCAKTNGIYATTVKLRYETHPRKIARSLALSLPEDQRNTFQCRYPFSLPVLSYTSQLPTSTPPRPHHHPTTRPHLGQRLRIFPLSQNHSVAYTFFHPRTIP